MQLLQNQLFFIKVWNDAHNAVENVRCLLDAGSNKTYISARLANSLNLEGPSTDLSIQLALGSSNVKSKSVSFYGRGLSESYVHKFDDVLVLDKLPDISDKFMSRSLRKKYAHLKNVPVSPKWADKELDIPFNGSIYSPLQKILQNELCMAQSTVF